MDPKKIARSVIGSISDAIFPAKACDRSQSQHNEKAKLFYEIAHNQNNAVKSDFIEFLSSKTKVFNEFEEMSSFVTSILRMSSYPFFVVDKSMTIQYMNPACLEFTGVAIDDAVGRISCSKIFDSSHCGKDCAVKQAMNTQRSVIGKKVKVRDKQNKEHTIVVTAGPLIDASGRVLGGFEIWRDAMPEDEITRRIDQFRRSLKEYCWDVEGFLDVVSRCPVTKELDDLKKREELVEKMKKKTRDLFISGNNLLKTYCWDILNCPAERQVQCPAFPNDGINCWEVDYTWCDGQMQGAAADKKVKCGKCPVYRNSLK